MSNPSAQSTFPIIALSHFIPRDLILQELPSLHKNPAFCPMVYIKNFFDVLEEEKRHLFFDGVYKPQHVPSFCSALGVVSSSNSLTARS